MKKIILILFILITGFGLRSNAQMMNSAFNFSSLDWNEIIQHTLREEEEGKQLWEKFRNKEIGCSDLNNEQLGAIGEYFMGQMTGESHAAMNAMMIQARGEDGEKQMHIVMGKRFLGCDPKATLPILNNGWMPMMNMMWGGRLPSFGINSTNNMMNFGFGLFNWFNLFFMISWWLIIIIGIITLIKWLIDKFNKKK